MKHTYKFTRTVDFRWYIDLPDWKGSKDELEMVMGADTMLDYLALTDDEIEIDLSTEPFDGFECVLIKSGEIYDGCNYWFNGMGVENFSVWLCEVTKFVFGDDYPNKIYLKRI